MKIKLFTIPNAITCLNLICGCLSVRSAFMGELNTAFLWIFLAAVFDFLDGFAAHLLQAFSDTGKQLDSLADVVSFGVAPGMALYIALNSSIGNSWVNYLVLAVPVFSALRLAKFNVDERQSDEFIGLPVPANALFLGSLAALTASEPHGMFASMLFNRWGIPAICFATSFLLVSEIPMISLKFKNFRFADNRSRYGVIFLSMILLAVAGLGGHVMVSIPVIICGYILLSILRNLGKKPQAAAQ